MMPVNADICTTALIVRRTLHKSTSLPVDGKLSALPDRRAEWLDGCRVKAVTRADAPLLRWGGGVCGDYVGASEVPVALPGRGRGRLARQNLLDLLLQECGSITLAQ